MSLYKRGSIWWVSIHRNGRHIQKSTRLTDKRMARAVEQALCLAGEALDGSGKRLVGEVENDEGKKRGLIRGLLMAVYGDDRDRMRLDCLWGEYETYVRARGIQISKRTLREKRDDYQAFLRWAKGIGVETLDGVTVKVAMSYSEVLSKRVSDKRRSNVCRSISSIWNCVLPAHPGISNPWPNVSPIIDVHASSRREFSREEEIAVMDAAKRVHPQWYMACLIARYTGLRYGDVCRLTWGDIDFEKEVISVIPRKTYHSSGVSVTIPMSKALLDTLTSWRSGCERVTQYDRVLPWLVERSPNGDKRFKVVLERAGLDTSSFSFHTWRHTLASRMGEAGVCIDVRKKILGHTTDVMAERYNHADMTESIRQGIDASSS